MSYDEKKSITQHLEELSRRLYRIVIAILIVSIILFMPLNFFHSSSFNPKINSQNPIEYIVEMFTYYLNVLSGEGYDSLTTRFIKFTRDYVLPNESIIIAGGSVTTFLVILKTTFVLAIMIVSPYIVYEIMAFIWPALYPHEKKIAKKYLLLATLYIVLGLTVGYFIVAKTVMRVGFFWARSVGAEFYINFQNFIDEVLNSMLGSMLVFLIPFFMIIATELDYLNPYTGFMSNRKLVYVIIWIVLVFFLPDVTAILLFIIFIAVFEPSYLYMKHIARRKNLVS